MGYMGATETQREAELAAECARLRVVMMRCVDLCVSELSAIETCAEIAGMLSDELFDTSADGKETPKWDALGWPNTPESPQWKHEQEDD